MPSRLPSSGGRPYRPSNGTEGMDFMAEWCDRCQRDTDVEETGGCRIIAAAMMFDCVDEEYPPEWVEDDRGYGSCVAFLAIEADHDFTTIMDARQIALPLELRR